MTKEILSKENIKLNAQFQNKEEAIRYTGDILVTNGYVQPNYVDKMLEREEVTSTFMGNFVAIPHGTEDSKGEVIETGISVVIAPEGVDFGDGTLLKFLSVLQVKEMSIWRCFLKLRLFFQKKIILRVL